MNRAGLVGVIGIVGTVGIAFLGAGGWLSPHALTPARMIDTFETVNGPHEGFRRNHAKGIGIHGTFTANSNGTRLSKAVVFEKGTVPVTGRFALAGGMPYAGDDATNVRSMALRFELPNGEEWRTGMNDIPVFVVRTPQEFHDQMVDKSFAATHPATAHAIGIIKARPHTDGFADDTYWSLNAFLLEGATTTPVRWKMVPIAPPAAKTTTGPNALFDALIQEVREKPLSWRLVMTLAAPGDVLDDATVMWPPEREDVDVGTLTIDKVESEEGSETRILNFDPLILPSGIKPSADPLLSARSAAYSQSVRRRLGEPVPSSAVGPAEVAR